MDRLHFGEVMTCIFTVTIDASSQFSNYVNMFGAAPPPLLSIPYLVLYNKYPRVADLVTDFASSMSAVQYKPETVVIMGIPNSPLVSQLTSCQLSSSIQGSNPSYALTSGWTTGYRSIYWYKSGSTYIKIAFGYSTIISSMLLTQLPANGYTTPFSSFKISFSNDDISYAFMPEVYFPSPLSGASFTYTLPNKYITCYYLRIHLTNIVTPSDLATKTSGLIIGQLYGLINTTTTNIGKHINNFNFIVPIRFSEVLISFTPQIHVRHHQTRHIMRLEAICTSLRSRHCSFAMKMWTDRAANATRQPKRTAQIGLVN